MRYNSIQMQTKLKFPSQPRRPADFSNEAAKLSEEGVTEIFRGIVRAKKFRVEDDEPDHVWEFHDVIFIDCIFATIDVRSAVRAIFIRCKFSGTQFSRNLADVMFEECKLSMPTFRGAHLKRIRFEKSYIIDADFYTTLIRDLCITDGCRLVGVGFDCADIERVDLRGSILEIGDVKSLAKVTITSEQADTLAVQIARATGLIVDAS